MGRNWIAAGLAGLLLFGAGVAVADEKGDSILAILERLNPSVLAVSYEHRAASPYLPSGGLSQTTTGVVVGPKTIMVATGAIEPMKNMPDLGKLLGGGGGGGGGFSAGPQAPTTFRITLSEDQELDARLSGRDEDMGLSFLTVEGDKELTPAEFVAEGDLSMAEEVVFVAPSLRRYLHRKRFHLTRVNEILDGKIYGVTTDAQSFLGGAAVSLDGKVLGIVGTNPEDLPKGDGAGTGGNPLASLAQGLLSSGQIKPSPQVLMYSLFKDLAQNPPENIKPESEGGDSGGGGGGGDDDWDDDEF